MLAEQENKIIGMIYDAALNPQLWQNVLAEIVDFTGSTTAIFTATDQLSSAYDFVFTQNIPPESMRAYQDEQVKILDMRLHVPYWQAKELGGEIQFSQHLNRMPICLWIQMNIFFMKSVRNLQM